jgi:hypothetical protein
MEFVESLLLDFKQETTVIAGLANGAPSFDGEKVRKTTPVSG